MLQVASAGGHKAVVQLLLEKDAHINMQGGVHGSMLHAASECGHEAVIRLLLEKDADINVQGGLTAAHSRQHWMVVTKQSSGCS